MRRESFQQPMAAKRKLSRQRERALFYPSFDALSNFHPKFEKKNFSGI